MSLGAFFAAMELPALLLESDAVNPEVADDFCFAPGTP